MVKVSRYSKCIGAKLRGKHPRTKAARKKLWKAAVRGCKGKAKGSTRKHRGRRRKGRRGRRKVRCCVC